MAYCSETTETQKSRHAITEERKELSRKESRLGGKEKLVSIGEHIPKPSHLLKFYTRHTFHKKETESIHPITVAPTSQCTPHHPF
jgi:hypothetical protein